MNNAKEDAAEVMLKWIVSCISEGQSPFGLVDHGRSLLGETPLSVCSGTSVGRPKRCARSQTGYEYPSSVSHVLNGEGGRGTAYQGGLPARHVQYRTKAG